MKWNILVLGINPFNKHDLSGIFFLIVKDEDVGRRSPCTSRDHRFSKQTCSPIRAQSGKERSTHTVLQERVKEMAIFTDRKLSQKAIREWCLKRSMKMNQADKKINEKTHTMR